MLVGVSIRSCVEQKKKTANDDHQRGEIVTNEEVLRMWQGFRPIKIRIDGNILIFLNPFLLLWTMLTSANLKLSDVEAKYRKQKSLGL